MAMTRDEFLRRVGEIHDEWEPRARSTITVDPEYSSNDPSQYPETITDISASPEADAEYWDAIDVLVKEYHRA